MMRAIEFGCSCESFSVGLAGDGSVIPEAGGGALRASTWPNLFIDRGREYRVRVTSAGKLVCDMPVRVHWMTQDDEPEPCLGLGADDPAELASALAAYDGLAVSLQFVPS